VACKVLLVDDEPDFLTVIRARLSKAGYDVICAHHGRDAMDKLRIKSPDVIVSDVIMPVMDGIDFYQQLKNSAETRKIPVIIMSIKEHLEQNFRAVGVDDFLAKPFEAADLIKKIQRCVEGRCGAV
jgi:CheY-like chemotaxis protein